MDEEMPQLRSYLFTVRIWLEEIRDGQMGWHGKAQSIFHGETVYFRDWSVLLAFLKNHIPENSAGVDPGPDRDDHSA